MVTPGHRRPCEPSTSVESGFHVIRPGENVYGLLMGRGDGMQQALTGPELLTVEEVATRLRVKPSWIYQHADDLGAFRLGKYLRFSWDRVLQRLERGIGGAEVGSSTQRPPASQSKVD